MHIQKGKILYLISFLFIFQTSFAQPWIYEYASRLKSTGEPTLTLKQRQDAFNAYWSDKDIKTNAGYKQFKRWENFMVPRASETSGLNNQTYWDALNQPSEYYSSDSIEWQFIGPGHTPFILNTGNLSGNGRLNCIAFHPSDSNTLYVGAPSGGMWMTTDGGQHWTPKSDNISSIGISDIVVSHENPNVIYLATGDRDHYDTYSSGILKSTDNGETWNQTAIKIETKEGITINRILMHPDNADIMLAATSLGIFRTIDGWESMTQVFDEERIIDMEYHPEDPNIVYASSNYYATGNSKIYLSVNGGRSFSEVSNNLNIYGKVGRIELATTPADPNLVYAVAADVPVGKLYGIFRSRNSGKDWEIVYNNSQKNLLGYSPEGADGLGQGHYDLAIAASPTNKSIVVVGGINNWKSTTGGFDWEIVSSDKHGRSLNYVHADQHMLVYSPHGNKKTLYALNDGGIYRSYNHGKSWEDISNNLQILQSYKLSTSKSSEYRIITGNQDNGTFLYSNSTWNEIFSGDGMECFIDPFNDNTLYYSLYYGRIYKSTDGGENPKFIAPDDSGAWVTPYLLNPFNSKTIYAAYRDIYKSNDGGETWVKLSQGLSNENFRSLTISPLNTKHLYAGTNNKLFRTINGGQDWEEISISSDIFYTSIAVSPQDPNKLWVSASNYLYNQQVFFSNNGGINWINYSDGLPNVPVNHLIVRPNSNQEIFAATDIGVFYRNSDLEYWENYSYNLPQVVVSELEISEPFNKLRAATYGRGIWELQLPPATPSKAEFASNIQNACTNAPITLYYTGSSTFDSLEWNINDGEILSKSINNDTLIIQYEYPGPKSIELRHYYNDTLTPNVKHQYLQVTNDLSFPIIPDKLYICDTSTIQIYLPAGYSYALTPSHPLVSLGDNFYNFKPQEDVSYAMTVSHGSCLVTEEEYILFMPDDICKAKYLNFGINGVYSNSCATSTLSEPVPGVGDSDNNGCSSQNGWCEDEDSVSNSVWFKLTVPENGKLRVRVTGFDSQVALYKAENCNDLTIGGDYELIAANDDLGLNKQTSEIGLIEGLVPGDTLFLQVDGSFGGVSGEFNVEISDKTTSNKYPYKINDIEYVVYPNPAEHEVNIKIKANILTDARIDLISLTGTILETRNIHGLMGKMVEQISVSGLHGIFLVRITIGQDNYYNKLIVQ